MRAGRRFVVLSVAALLLLLVGSAARRSLVDEEVERGRAPRPTPRSSVVTRPVSPRETTPVVSSASAPSPAAAIDTTTCVALVGAVRLDDAPLANATLHLTDGTSSREVSTRDDGGFQVALPPGEWRVSLVDGPADAMGAVLLYDDAAALVAALARPRRPNFLRHSAGPLLRVSLREPVAPHPAEGPPPPRVARPGSAFLVRFLSPWVLEGVIVDAESDTPVAGARVSARPPETGQEMTTGANGRFCFVAPRTADVLGPTVHVQAPGRAPVDTRLVPDLDAPGRRRPVRIALRRPLTLDGRVTDQDGRPLPATVEVTTRLPDVRTGEPAAHTRFEAACDRQGRFVVDGITPGAGESQVGPHAAAVSFSVQHPGYAHVAGSRIVTPNGEPLHVRLTRLHTLTGRVIDADGRPVADAHVRAALPTTPAHDGDLVLSPSASNGVRTGADGRFVLTDVPERTLVQADAQGLPPTRLEVWLPAGDLLLCLSRAAAPITGRVVKTGGEPVPGARVFAVTGGKGDDADRLVLTRAGTTRPVAAPPVFSMATADEAGRFTLSSLAGSRVYDLLVDERWRDRLARALADVQPGTQDLTLVLEPLPGPTHVTVALPGDTGLRRVVLERRTADGTLVELHRTAAMAGRAEVELERLQPGTSVLVVRAEGFVPVLQAVEVVPGCDATIGPVILAPGGGRAVLHVTWPPGRPPALLLRWRDPASGLECVERLRPPGALDVPIVTGPLPAGVATLAVVEARGVAASIELTIRDDETTRVDLDLTTPTTR